MTIWKYPFTVNDTVVLEMPHGAKVLKVECQNNQPCLWALVLPDAPKEERHFRIVGTGHPFDAEGYRHIDTFQHHDGRLVWHVFELGEPTR